MMHQRRVRRERGPKERRRARALALSLVASAIALGVPILATPAAAQGGACPNPASEFRLWDVATEPYQADNAADRNADGRVCARPAKGTFEFNGQTYRIYLFIDDNVRA